LMILVSPMRVRHHVVEAGRRFSTSDLGENVEEPRPASTFL
jgi:hypothetical protein